MHVVDAELQTLLFHKVGADGCGGVLEGRGSGKFFIFPFFYYPKYNNSAQQILIYSQDVKNNLLYGGKVTGVPCFVFVHLNLKVDF